ncbi:hypothetical protein EX30DRAFT_44308 [Ascodesmis nigricans]|uniref:Sister chromatid cohesion protein Dcc1 n=1 Tax=Ascodesmis nigricans TaxID=341454 RepID=A0A4S2MWA6_9PEZI|nr:hypothetical protein EX30DRAFT_44308 [Ascodesmis nigricans]
MMMGVTCLEVDRNSASSGEVLEWREQRWFLAGGERVKDVEKSGDGEGRGVDALVTRHDQARLPKCNSSGALSSYSSSSSSTLIFSYPAMSAPPPSSAAADSGIPLDYLHDQSTVRLIELPPAVLSLLTSSSTPILQIKATTPPEKAPTSSSAYNAVLCTSSQTYALRQVSTSNTIFLTTPDATGQRLTATSTITSHLELFPNPNSPSALLQPHLQPYNGWEDADIRSTTMEDVVDEPVTRMSLLPELPISDGEFTEAWRASGAFEWRGKIYQPTPTVLVKALQVIFTATTAERLGIETEVGVKIEDIMKAIDDDEVPRGLIEGVIGVVCDELDTGRWKLNLERCCKVAGKAVLQAWGEAHKVAKGPSDLLYVGFMKKWKDAVPHSCKGLCKTELIEDWYTMPTPNTIRFNPSGSGSPSSTGDSTVTTSAAFAPAASKNKWHEKFRKGKIK